jgi:hypothetical protein
MPKISDRALADFVGKTLRKARQATRSNASSRALMRRT